MNSESSPRLYKPRLTPLSTFYQVTATAITFGVTTYYFTSDKRPNVTILSPVLLESTPERTDVTSKTPLYRSLKPEHNVSLANLRIAQEKIIAIVSEENVDDRLDEIKRYTGSEWSSRQGSLNEAPAAIVRPDSTEQVSEIMKICHSLRIPVVASSSGTSLESHFANGRRGISLDLGRINRILASHKDDLDVVVQPGIAYEELNQALAEQVIKIPPIHGSPSYVEKD